MKDQYYFKKQRKAIVEDATRKELFKELFELYATAVPIVLKKPNGYIVCRFDKKTETAAELIKDKIAARDNVIFKENSK